MKVQVFVYVLPLSADSTDDLVKTLINSEFRPTSSLNFLSSHEQWKKEHLRLGFLQINLTNKTFNVYHATMFTNIITVEEFKEKYKTLLTSTKFGL